MKKNKTRPTYFLQQISFLCIRKNTFVTLYIYIFLYIIFFKEECSRQGEKPMKKALCVHSEAIVAGAQREEVWQEQKTGEFGGQGHTGPQGHDKV